MSAYEYGRIRALAENLRKQKVAPVMIEQIMAGGEVVRANDACEVRAEWMRGAMLRMDSLLDEPTRIAVREGCACCLGGKRRAMSKSIAATHATLEARIAAANEAKFVFGHSVEMLADGRIQVSFAPDGLAHYGCPCMPKAKETMPITYCMCCGGHAKRHLQTALGRKFSCTVVSSALSSGGTKPCKFRFDFVD